jgi:hypothetical protein
MKFRSMAKHFGYSILGALALISVASSRMLAQDGHSHGAEADRQELTFKQKEQLNALVKVVRDATARYKDVRVAEYDDYHLQFGCVTGPDFGAMGLHYVNMGLVGDGEIDAARPEIVIYEPQPNGKPKLIGADFLVLADQWNATHQGPPQLMGQLFHLFETPNRFGLPAFYTLHVWAWKDNPTGTFTNWHSNVSCDAFGGDKH